MIKSGELDIAIAGGAEACVHPLPMAGFAQMRAMSTRNDDPQGASRPFDIERDGFVLGEGAGIMVLERADHAKARGAKIYGRLAGIGMSNDAYHITAPEPDGEGPARAIAKALQLGRPDRRRHRARQRARHVHPGRRHRRVEHHPAGHRRPPGGHRHQVDDRAHARRGRRRRGASRPCWPSKDGVVPGTRNLNKLDPEIKVDVATENRQVTLTAALNDSFGFGGHNVALVFTGA